MKLKPQPLGWTAAICTAIFIVAGMTNVSIPGEGKSLPTQCGSPWNDLGRTYVYCQGSHVGAIVIMSLAAGIGLICLVLFAVLVLPGALRPEDPAAPRPAEPPRPPAPSAPRTATPNAPALPAPRVVTPRAPALSAPRIMQSERAVGWYPDPEDPKAMRYWTGQKWWPSTGMQI